MDLSTAGVASDFTLFDWRETVTYIPYSRTTDALDTGAAVANVPALRRVRGVAEDDAAEAGRVVVPRLRWHLRASALGATPVTKRGLILAADGTGWIVEDVRHETFAARYVCECHRYP